MGLSSGRGDRRLLTHCFLFSSTHPASGASQVQAGARNVAGKSLWPLKPALRRTEGNRPLTAPPNALVSSFCQFSLSWPFGSQMALPPLVWGDKRRKMETRLLLSATDRKEPSHPAGGSPCHSSGHSKCPVLFQTSLCPSSLFPLDFWILLSAKLVPPKVIFKNVN